MKPSHIMSMPSTPAPNAMRMMWRGTADPITCIMDSGDKNRLSNKYLNAFSLASSIISAVNVAAFVLPMIPSIKHHSQRAAAPPQ
ncbi:hypothetical protein PF004_g22210 [Phytophthora fragariae]|uniref:Uncharacterized protein n=1 Tax=Phytophthora fragariae TaxID=53985 RepID=A0A6G0N1F0_9STRA|nr:hypothetical protein PF004_g22210 [Phytophthora fragariae]